MNVTGESIDAWLAALPEVRIAETEQEREAIFAFCYRVSMEESGKNSDPGRRRFSHPGGQRPDTTLLYIEDGAGIAGTVQVRHWEPGDVPINEFQTYSMDRFKGIGNLRTAEMGRLIMRPGCGGPWLAALCVAVFNMASINWQTDLVFSNCTTELVRRYGLLGWRRYAGRMIPTPDGFAVPLVMVVSDVESFRAAGSLLTPLVERDDVQSLDTTPFVDLFKECNLPVQFDKELLRAAIACGVAADVGFWSGLSPQAVDAVVDNGFLIQVPFGELLAEAGLRQRELFVIIDGEFESFSEERMLHRMYPGEVIGDIASFGPDGRRTAWVRCANDARVLVLSPRVIDELRYTAPDVAAEIFFQLAHASADRTGDSLSVSASDTPA